MHKHARFVAAALILASTASKSALAWPSSDCKFNAERQAAVNLAGGEGRDTSGDLEIARVAGALDVTYSSGDLRIEEVRGALTITDSSGDISVRNAGASVRVSSDSSGYIDISAVKGSVKIDNDS